MELYRVGKIISIGKNYLILETNFRGEIIYVANPQSFEQGKIRKIYTYNYETNFSKHLYGFLSFSERILFEDLLKVSGVGPKTSLNLIKMGYKTVIQYIVENNVTALSKCPNLGTKSVHQIVLALKGKYRSFQAGYPVQDDREQVRKSLTLLGFKTPQIEFAIKNTIPNQPLEEMIQNAIKLIANEKFI